MTPFVQTTRARAVEIRSYCRPLDNEGSVFESRVQMVSRAFGKHHKELLKQVGARNHKDELADFEALGHQGKSSVAGRTLWLGGTEYAYNRAACQFNCAFEEVSTVYELVNVAWLLLNGCGVGFKPRTGTLHGYTRPIPEVQIIPSTRAPSYRGLPYNVVSPPAESNGYTWTIHVGDSAEAWAKAGAKLFVPPSGEIRKLVLDYRECRGPGERLKGYGWICNGYKPFANAMLAMHDILNASAGQLLDDIQIMDICNWWGSVLSSRRAAEIAIMDSHNPRVKEFSRAKYKYWETGNNQRRQSNNTIVYWNKPSRARIEELLHEADECGGDPAIANGEGALRRAPWFQGFNPCGEILLPRSGFCNLVTNCLPRFRRNFAEMERAVYLMGRANYRQTCVDLNDGILTPSWHQTNQSLRLCGVSLTGIVQADWLTDYQIRRLRDAAVSGAYSQADELKMPRPKAVTTIKPEGTISKTFGGLDIGEVAEGIHKPLGRFILNWVNFSIHDPLVGLLEAAGYKVLPSPSDPNNVLVCFPVEYSGIRFDSFDGKEVNLEPATTQLDRYLRWNTLWADHNVSCTISYSYDEIPSIAEWIDRNWDRGFIAVSFLRRNDPTKTAKDLGHPYLPQEVVTEGPFRDYQSSLREVDWRKVKGIFEIGEEACATGACPSK